MNTLFSDYWYCRNCSGFFNLDLDWEKIKIKCTLCGSQYVTKHDALDKAKMKNKTKEEIMQINNLISTVNENAKSNCIDDFTKCSMDELQRKLIVIREFKQKFRDLESDSGVAELRYQELKILSQLNKKNKNRWMYVINQERYFLFQQVQQVDTTLN